MPLLNVAIPAAVHTAFTYDSTNDIPVGSRVLVPFGKRKMVGIVLGNAESTKIKNVKSIESVLDEKPIFDSKLVKLIQWISSYYIAPIGEVCKIALPKRLWNIKAQKTTRTVSPIDIHSISDGKFNLTEQQKEVLNTIIGEERKNHHAVFLLHGITGSGKTEIYLRIFEQIIKDGKQGLLLVPEIGLTPQLLGRTYTRFGDRVAVYHSGLTDAQRFSEWTKIRDGKIDVVIGTRSALFAPILNLGAIVVDEEHDSSYKQDDGVTYNGRDAAIMRAHMTNIPIILGSATPSLESIANVKREKYKYCKLPERPGGAKLPNVEIVDMRKFQKNEPRKFVALSPRLHDAISETLLRKEQTLLYIGRRGFAGSLQCEACGNVVMCPNCDIALTSHEGRIAFSKYELNLGGPTEKALACHYCGYRTHVPNVCASCGETPLTPVGHGTERLEAEIKDFFPEAAIARFDSDSITNSKERHKILGDMRKGKIDILIGTQMITKGHDFPAVTLVGVVAADVSLNLPDFRAAERTFQLLTQVAGRAGRANLPGQVIIQTHQPNHISFQAAAEHSIDKFAEEEIIYRQKLLYPPFTRLANIRISSNKKDAAKNAAELVSKLFVQMREKIEDKNKIEILGPAPAPIEKIRNRFRWQLLIKAHNPNLLAKLLEHTRTAIAEKIKSDVRVSIDVDPVNLL